MSHTVVASAVVLLVGGRVVWAENGMVRRGRYSKGEYKVKERGKKEMKMERGGVESIYRRFKLYDFIGQGNKEKERERERSVSTCPK